VNVFTRLLLKRNHTLSLYDTDSSKSSNVADKLGCKSSNSIKELAETSDILIICTPLENTPKVIQETIKQVTDITLIEIASLKKKTIPALKKTPKNIQTASIHPMFGPDTIDLRDKTIITIPVKDQRVEKRITKTLFPEANHIVLDMDIHDRYMSLILALPYFINIVFLKSLPIDDIGIIKNLAGPTFRTQYALAECILSEDPDFVKSLIEDNVYVRDNINEFVYEFKYLRRLLKNTPSKLGDYFLEVKNAIGFKNDFENSRRIRNWFLETWSSDDSKGNEHE
jgi:prephenate dehydrogenase